MSSLLTEPTVAVLIVAGHVAPFDAVRWARVEAHIEAEGTWRRPDCDSETVWRSWPAARVEIRAARGDE